MSLSTYIRFAECVFMVSASVWFIWGLTERFVRWAESSGANADKGELLSLTLKDGSRVDVVTGDALEPAQVIECLEEAASMLRKQ